jgi:hypothetical protein
MEAFSEIVPRLTATIRTHLPVLVEKDRLSPPSSSFLAATAAK